MLIRALVSVLLLWMPLVGQSIECATRQCYAVTYNSVDPAELPVLDRVHDIYARLTQTIGTQQAYRSTLMVIDSDGFPWAVALKDNSIVITRGAIERMYQERDLALGDARLAFVLGHELSHLGTEDLFHHRAFLVKQKHAFENPLLPKPAEELRADLRGYTFATIAGFQTELLISGEQDFFRDWLSQIATDSSPTHPSNESRRASLQEGFEQILDDVHYYWFAIALAHFGHYKDAQVLLEDHLNLVETVEAFGNLGYVHLQRARSYMSDKMAYKYWIPTILEPNSRLTLTRDRSLFDRELPAQAMAHLRSAEKLLKHAVNMDEQALTHYINLAAVYLYMPDKVHRAYAAIEDALQTPLGKVPAVRQQLESIYQLIRISDDADRGDRWSTARETLLPVASKQSAPDNLLFNFARMLDERGRNDTALPYWERLYDRLQALPPAYQTQVCFRLEKDRCEVAPTRHSPWVTERFPLGQDIRYPQVVAYLKEHWNSRAIREKRLSGLQAQVFTNEQGDLLLALDHQLEMMIFRNVPSPYQDLNELLNRFGTPPVSLPVSGGQLLAFNDRWSARVSDEQVVELWIADLALDKNDANSESTRYQTSPSRFKDAPLSNPQTRQ